MNVMSRIERLFSHDKALVAYLTAGDGGIERTFQAAMALIEGGVTMLEIGMPFSDPVADGPVIQRAAARALASGTTLRDVLWLAKKIRERSQIPLILFSYLNPILSALPTDFLRRAHHAGIDGLLLVDCPLEESAIIREQCIEQDISLIQVITPATRLDRIKQIDSQARGFLYYACQKGTTGIRKVLPDDFQSQMAAMKAIVRLPVVVGFGVSNRAMVSEILAHADGVVIGSLFVQALENGESPEKLATLAAEVMGS